MKKQKVTQKQINDYINVIKNATPPGLSIARALLNQGFSEVEINRYLLSQGTSEDQALNIIRELNR